MTGALLRLTHCKIHECRFNFHVHQRSLDNHSIEKPCFFGKSRHLDAEWHNKGNIEVVQLNSDFQLYSLFLPYCG